MNSPATLLFHDQRQRDDSSFPTDDSMPKHLEEQKKKPKKTVPKGKEEKEPDKSLQNQEI